jgi:hypothetical protein
LRFFFLGCVEVFADLADCSDVAQPIRDGLYALARSLKDDLSRFADRLCDRLGSLA